MILPTLNECTIAVRCCPVYFELREDGPAALVPLPYRMIFAVATESSILLYDTQQISPIGVVSLIHYGRLNDLSWYVIVNMLCCIIRITSESYLIAKPSLFFTGLAMVKF